MGGSLPLVEEDGCLALEDLEKDRQDVILQRSYFVLLFLCLTSVFAMCMNHMPFKPDTFPFLSKREQIKTCYSHLSACSRQSWASVIFPL